MGSVAEIITRAVATIDHQYLTYRIVSELLQYNDDAEHPGGKVFPVVVFQNCRPGIGVAAVGHMFWY